MIFDGILEILCRICGQGDRGEAAGDGRRELARAAGGRGFGSRMIKNEEKSGKLSFGDDFFRLLTPGAKLCNFLWALK